MSSRQLWPVAALGTAGAVLVDRDGSPAWQVARVLVVVTVTAAVLLAVARTVVCLVAGLVLLVGGAVTLARQVHGWRRPVLVVGLRGAACSRR